MNDLTALEEQLRELAHSTEALGIIQRFAAQFKKTKQRQEVFNAPGALVVVPALSSAEAVQRGLVADDEDGFLLLQGDVIASDSAYFMGERLTGMRFLVASATCDLVPGRREYAVLLPLQPIRASSDPAAQKQNGELLAQLLRFTSTQRMYLPPLPGDSSEVLANAVVFDGFAQIRLTDLLLAHRLASLSLVGWHIFASHLGGILTRTGPGEVALRAGWTEPT